MFSLSSAETASRACCTAGGGEESVARGVVKWKDTLHRIVCSTPPPAAPTYCTRGGGIYWLNCACRHNITVLERMERAVLCLQRTRCIHQQRALCSAPPSLLSWFLEINGMNPQGLPGVGRAGEGLPSRSGWVFAGLPGVSVRPTHSHLLLLVSAETSLPQLPLPPAHRQSGSTTWEMGVAFRGGFLWPNMTFLGCFS